MTQQQDSDMAVPCEDGVVEQYLKHVTEVGDRRAITATEDICSTSGVKLLAAGYQVNSSLLDKLLRHKLLKPIDHSCVVENAIDSAYLVSRARELLNEQKEFAALIEQETTGDFLHACFGHMQLPTAIRNKLTVLAEQAPRLIDHSLWCTMGSIFLGQKLDMNMVEERHLASAALLHDIGQLHIDHRILDPKERLDEALRRQVQTHPVIGGSIIDALDVYDKAVSRAVLEHHERADGSGYPGGLRGDQMSLAGRILSFIEFSLGIRQSAGARHLAIVIRTYAHQFDPVITRVFWEHFNVAEPLEKYPFDTRDIPALYARLSDILEGWEAVQEHASAQAWTLAERDFRAIRRAFSSVGLAPDLIEDLEASEPDSEAHLEACSVLREGLRQAREATDILSRAAQDDPDMRKDTVVLEWLENTTQALNAR
ncbi:HD-GYP domain-containing protein [Chromatocurvus halotolerans]|nr:HD domain-containing phosphohydrolase [Chromatocurvus halotolerans]